VIIVPDPDDVVLQNLQRQASREERLERRQRERTDEALDVLAGIVAAHGGRVHRVALRTLRVELSRLRRRNAVA
jgi:hypothetical protein